MIEVIKTVHIFLKKILPPADDLFFPQPMYRKLYTMLLSFYHKHSLIRLAAGMALLLAVFCLSCKKSNKPELPQFGTCQDVAAKGHLTKGAVSGSFIYKTNGGGTITIDQSQIILTHDNYPEFKLEYWTDISPDGQTMNSANHESLNGKHIKDRIDSRPVLFS